MGCGLRCALAASLLCAWATSAQGSFVKVEDFEGLTPGSINGQNEWFAAAITSQVAADPADSANQVLSVVTDSTRLYKPLLIANGTMQVLFLRFRFGGQQMYSFGMSDMAGPDQFGDFEAEVGMANQSNDLRINDGQGYSEVAELLPDTWYNAWLVIDNIADQTEVYLHDRTGEDATATDQLKSIVGNVSVFDFRDGVAGDLRTLFIKTGGGSSENSGPLMIDDIYIDAGYSGGALANPTVPEPGGLALTMVATAALLRRARRR